MSNFSVYSQRVNVDTFEDCRLPSGGSSPDDGFVLTSTRLLLVQSPCFACFGPASPSSPTPVSDAFHKLYSKLLCSYFRRPVSGESLWSCIMPPARRPCRLLV